MLLDRRPDVFLARRSGAEGWMVKPLDPLRLRRADDRADRRRHLLATSPFTVPVLVVVGRAPGGCRPDPCRGPVTRPSSVSRRITKTVRRPSDADQPGATSGGPSQALEAEAAEQERFILEALPTCATWTCAR